ncbi:arogenate dehydrogenase (NADP(+)) [Ranunculus cassubicifolius]
MASLNQIFHTTSQTTFTPKLTLSTTFITTSTTILYESTSSRFSKLRLKCQPPRSNYIINQISSFSDPISTIENVPKTPLKIGIIGFGNFGQFIAKALTRQGHYVFATSRSEYSEYCQQNGIQFLKNVDSLCEEQPDVLFVCSSILSTETVVRSIPMHKLKPDTIFADVLSVKQFPKNLFLELPFVFDKVRICESSAQAQKCDQFLSIFEQEGCRMVEMSCEEHDRHAAGSQFITHTIGRILSHLELESTPINTKGYETLLQLTENTVSDSFDLYYGLFMYNVNATDQIENLDRAFETVKQKLFGRLHDILRKQIVHRVPLEVGPSRSNVPRFLPNTENMQELSSFAIPPPQLSHQNNNDRTISHSEGTVASRPR